MIATLATRRMIAAHTIGARIAPIDTGHEHGPIAEHVRHAETGAPGYLLASYDAGRESLVLWRRSGWLERLPTISTRLDWSAA